jgi:hypothetical protein
MKGDTRCIEGRFYRHEPRPDDPDLETDVGECPECEGEGCRELDELPNCVWRGAFMPFCDTY